MASKAAEADRQGANSANLQGSLLLTQSKFQTLANRISHANETALKKEVDKIKRKSAY